MSSGNALGWPASVSEEDVKNAFRAYVSDNNPAPLAALDPTGVIQRSILERFKVIPAAVSTPQALDTVCYQRSEAALNAYRGELVAYRILQAVIGGARDVGTGMGKLASLAKETEAVAVAAAVSPPIQKQAAALQKKRDARRQLEESSSESLREEAADAARREARLRDEQRALIAEQERVKLEKQRMAEAEQRDREAALERSRVALLGVMSTQAQAIAQFPALVDAKEYAAELAIVEAAERDAFVASGDSDEFKVLVNEINVSKKMIVWTTRKIVTLGVFPEDDEAVVLNKMADLDLLGRFTSKDILTTGSDAAPKIDQLTVALNAVRSFYDTAVSSYKNSKIRSENYAKLIYDVRSPDDTNFVADFRTAAGLTDTAAYPDDNALLATFITRVNENGYDHKAMLDASNRLARLYSTKLNAFFVGRVAASVDQKRIAERRAQLEDLFRSGDDRASRPLTVLNYIDKLAKEIRATLAKAGTPEGVTISKLLRQYRSFEGLWQAITLDRILGGADNPAGNATVPDSALESVTKAAEEAIRTIEAELFMLTDANTIFTLGLLDVDTVESANAYAAQIAERGQKLSKSAERLRRLFLTPEGRAGVKGVLPFNSVAGLAARTLLLAETMVTLNCLKLLRAEFQERVAKSNEVPLVVPNAIVFGDREWDTLDKINFDIDAVGSLICASDLHTEYRALEKLSSPKQIGALNSVDVLRLAVTSIHQLYTTKVAPSHNRIARRRYTARQAYEKRLAKAQKEGTAPPPPPPVDPAFEQLYTEWDNAFKALAKINTKCSKAESKQAKPFTAGEKPSSKKEGEKRKRYQSIVSEWNTRFPEYKRLEALVEKQKPLPAVTATNLIEGAKALIEQARLDYAANKKGHASHLRMMAVDLKSFCTTLRSVVPSAAALAPAPAPLPLSSTPPAKELVGPEIKDQAQEIREAAIGRLMEDIEKAMEAEDTRDKLLAAMLVGSRRPGSVGAVAARDELSRLGTRWVSVEPLPKDNRDRGTFLLDYMPKLSAALACVALANGVFKAAEVEVSAELMRMSRSVSVKHTSLFRTKTAQGVPQADVDQAWEIVVTPAYNLYELYSTRVVGKFKRTLFNTMSKALSAVVNSDDSDDAWNRIFGANSKDLVAIYGSKTKLLVETIWRGNGLFQLFTAGSDTKDQRAELTALHPRVLKDITKVTTSSPDIDPSTTTVQQVARALFDIRERAYAVEYATDKLKSAQELANISARLLVDDVQPAIANGSVLDLLAEENDVNELRDGVVLGVDIAGIQSRHKDLMAFDLANADGAAKARYAQDVSDHLAQVRDVYDVTQNILGIQAELNLDVQLTALDDVDAMLESFFETDEKDAKDPAAANVAAVGGAEPLAVSADMLTGEDVTGIAASQLGISNPISAQPSTFALEEACWSKLRTANSLIHGMEDGSLMLALHLLVGSPSESARLMRILTRYRLANFVYKNYLYIGVAIRTTNSAVRTNTLNQVAKYLDDAIGVIREEVTETMRLFKFVPVNTNFSAARAAQVFVATKLGDNGGVDTTSPEVNAPLSTKPLAVAADKMALLDYQNGFITATELQERIASISALSDAGDDADDADERAEVLLSAMEFYIKGAVFVIAKNYLGEIGNDPADTEPELKLVGLDADKSPTLKVLAIYRNMVTRMSLLARVVRRNNTLGDADTPISDGRVNAITKELEDSIVLMLDEFAKAKGIIKTYGRFFSESITAAMVGSLISRMGVTLNTAYNQATNTATVEFAKEVAASASAPSPAPAPAPAPVPPVVTPTPAVAPPIVAAPDDVSLAGSPPPQQVAAVDVAAAAAKAKAEAEAEAVKIARTALSSKLDDATRDIRQEAANKQLAHPSESANIQTAQNNALDKLRDVTNASGIAATAEGVNLLGSNVDSIRALWRDAIQQIDARANAAAADKARQDAEAALKLRKDQKINELKRETDEFEKAVDAALNEFNAFSPGFPADAARAKTLAVINNARGVITASREATSNPKTLVPQLNSQVTAVAQARASFGPDFDAALGLYKSEVNRLTVEDARKGLKDQYDFVAPRVADARKLLDDTDKISGALALPERQAATSVLASAEAAVATLLSESQRGTDPDLMNAKSTSIAQDDMTEVAELEKAVEAYKNAASLSALMAAPPAAPAVSTASTQAAGSAEEQPPSVTPAPEPFVSAPPAAAAVSAKPKGKVPALTGVSAAAEAEVKALEQTESGRVKLSESARGILPGIQSDVSNLADLQNTLAQMANMPEGFTDSKMAEGFYRAIYFWAAIGKSNQDRSLAVLFVPKGYVDKDTDAFTAVNADAGDVKGGSQREWRILVDYGTKQASPIAARFKGITILPNRIPFKGDKGGIRQAVFIIVAYRRVGQTERAKSKWAPEAQLGEAFARIGRSIYTDLERRKWDLGAWKSFAMSEAGLTNAVYGPETSRKSIEELNKDTNSSIAGIADDAGSAKSFKGNPFGPSANAVIKAFKQAFEPEGVSGVAEQNKAIKRDISQHAGFVMWSARTHISSTKKKPDDDHLKQPNLIQAPINGDESDRDTHINNALSEDSDWGFEDGGGHAKPIGAPIGQPPQHVPAPAPVPAAPHAVVPTAHAERPDVRSDPNTLPDEWGWS